ncbi:hypothetical protein MTO96_051722 [Rhipicephalus appendiculatus]
MSVTTRASKPSASQLGCKTELSQNLQALSEKAKTATEFIQGLKGMSERVHEGGQCGRISAVIIGSGVEVANLAAPISRTLCRSRVGQTGPDASSSTGNRLARRGRTEPRMRRGVTPAAANSGRTVRRSSPRSRPSATLWPRPLEARRRELLAFARREREAKLKALKGQLANCTVTLQRTTALLQFCIEALKETDHAAFLQIGPGLIHRVANVDVTWHKDMEPTPWASPDST